MSPKADHREVNLRVRFHLDEREMLHDLQRATGLNAADWLRQAIRKEHAKLAATAKAPANPAKKK